MRGDLAVLVEILLVFGVVMALGWWELRRTRRAQREDDAAD